MMIDVGVCGAAGRMGRELVTAVAARSDMHLKAAMGASDSPSLGQDVGVLASGSPNGVVLQSDVRRALTHVGVLIDFTQPAASLSYLNACVEANKPLVIGTTGFSRTEQIQIKQASSQIPLVFAPNMSAGVNLMFKLVEMAAQVLHADSDIEIMEAHHKNKVDAPSGTALHLGKVVAEAMSVPLDEVAVYAREGHTGVRPEGKIGFSTVRAGDIVGEHTVLYASDGERLEITHKAGHRKNFAQGAVRAAAWLVGQPPGLYSMQDVLGLNRF